MKKILFTTMILLISSSVCFGEGESVAFKGGKIGAPKESSQGKKLKAIKPLSGTSEIAPASRENKISLDIKGMAIVDLLKMISLRAGVNIVVGKNVKGDVSMFLRDIGIWDAFEIILLANDLAYIEEDNGIVNVMTKKDYANLRGAVYKDKKEMEVVKLKHIQAKDLEKTLEKVKTDIGNIIIDDVSNSLILLDTKQGIARMKLIALNSDILLETKVFSLSYATVDDMSAVVEELLSTVGKASFDARTDKMVITDTPEVINKIIDVVKAFDEKPRQVLIDAQIIELKPSKNFRMGIDWDYFMSKYFRVQGPFTAPISAESGDISPFTFGTIGGAVTQKHDWKVIADALETLGDVKLLSSPRIMALDGQEAKILVGTKQPYLTSKTTPVGDSAQTSFNFETVDVGIQLHVTPYISRDGFVSMQIKPVVSSSEYQNLGTEDEPRIYPVETTSEVETSVVIKAGTTIIIGGLRKEEKRHTENRIPFLGKIPLLKYVFGNTSDDNSVSDLVVLLTPHIVEGEESLTDFNQLKPTDGVVYEMKDNNLFRTEY